MEYSTMLYVNYGDMEDTVIYGDHYMKIREQHCRILWHVGPLLDNNLEIEEWCFLRGPLGKN
jgi:hypothetical protein